MRLRAMTETGDWQISKEFIKTTAVGMVSNAGAFDME